MCACASSVLGSRPIEVADPAKPDAEAARIAKRRLSCGRYIGERGMSSREFEGRLHPKAKEALDLM